MKSLPIYIVEKLLINKNIRRIPKIEGVGSWDVIDKENGYIHMISTDVDSKLVNQMFSNIYDQPVMNWKTATNKFMNEHKSILASTVDADGCDNHIVCGYDKKVFGGAFMLWFIDRSNDLESDIILSLAVYYGRMFDINLIISTIRNNDDYLINDKDLDVIMRTYKEIERNTR